MRRVGGQGSRIRLSYGGHRSQTGDLWLPDDVGAGTGATPVPVVVVLHGGFWKARYGKRLMDGLAADLAGRGWAAWNLEYRRVGLLGAGGWPATFDDVAAGIDHLGALTGSYPLDLDRVITVGHSAGGHLALWAAGRPRLPSGAPGRFGANGIVVTATVGLGAVSDLAEAARGGLGGGAAVRLLGGPPAQRPDRYAAASPAALLPLGVTQVMVHGQADPTVPVSMSEGYVKRAVAAGDDATLVVLPGVGHFELIDPATAAWATTVTHIKGLLP